VKQKLKEIPGAVSVELCSSRKKSHPFLKLGSCEIILKIIFKGAFSLWQVIIIIITWRLIDHIKKPQEI
jgi:hypothetical protein